MGDRETRHRPMWAHLINEGTYQTSPFSLTQIFIRINAPLHVT